MRFVAPNPVTICLRDPVEEPDPYHPGRHKISEPGVRAQFVTGDFTLKEKQIAQERFHFTGLPVDEYTQMPVDPSYRIGTFDTSMQGWDEETRRFAEEALLNNLAHGPEYILVEVDRAVAPWAGYDTLAGDKVVEMVKATGSDPEDVITYERENKNRKTVISALEELLDPADETVIQA